MNSWWSGLEFRERVILSVAVMIALVILLDTFVLQGFSAQSQQLDEKIEQAKEDLNWMRVAVNRLPSGNKVSRKVHSGRIVNYIDQQITRQGLKKNMLQMTPVQEHSARLRLSDVEFNKLLKFFTAIEGSVSIQEVRLLPTDTNGFVNVSLVISNGRGA